MKYMLTLLVFVLVSCVKVVPVNPEASKLKTCREEVEVCFDRCEDVLDVEDGTDCVKECYMEARECSGGRG